MIRKYLTIVLLFAFISCGSSESDSVTESIEPNENTTSTTTSVNRGYGPICWAKINSYY